MTSHVRPLVPQDRAAWETLWASYNAFYGRSGATALPASVVDTSWKRLLAPDVTVHGFIALSNTQPVGLAHIVLHDNLIQIEQTCYLQDLFVDETARGQRISHHLLKSVQAFCQSRGLKDMYWHTQASNMPARSVYDKIAKDTGFIVYRQRFGTG